MQVNFTDVEDYLAEIEAQKDAIKLVRCEIRANAVNNCVNEYMVISGFEIGEDLYQLQANCGQSPAGRKEIDAKETLGKVGGAIEQLCQAHGLQMRGGAHGC